MNAVTGSPPRPQEGLRYEIKMVLEAQRLGEVRSWVLSHPAAFRVAFPRRQVNNIYFDTPDRRLADEHIQGVAQRAKLRFRWYGDTWVTPGGQLEVKIKEGQLSRKLIHPITARLNLLAQQWREIMGALHTECPEGIAGHLGRLSPVLINQYQREYFISAEGTLRLTLDYQLRAYDQTFGFSPNTRFPQPLLDNLVIEIKAPAKAHSQVADALAAFPLRVTDNSKYLSGLETAF